MNSNTFKCSVCEETFKKGRTEEEAIKEMQETFTVAIEKEDCDIVCDDCYHKIMYPEELNK